MLIPGLTPNFSLLQAKQCPFNSAADGIGANACLVGHLRIAGKTVTITQKTEADKLSLSNSQVVHYGRIELL